MPRQVGHLGASGITNIGDAPNAPHGKFNTNTPAGWTMIWWGAAVLLILIMFFML